MDKIHAHFYKNRECSREGDRAIAARPRYSGLYQQHHECARCSFYHGCRVDKTKQNSKDFEFQGIHHRIYSSAAATRRTCRPKVFFSSGCGCFFHLPVAIFFYYLLFYFLFTFTCYKLQFLLQLQLEIKIIIWYQMMSFDVREFSVCFMECFNRQMSGCSINPDSVDLFSRQSHLMYGLKSVMAWWQSGHFRQSFSRLAMRIRFPHVGQRW